MANRLKQEKSPYLLQHGENPVDWYPWGEAAFLKAKQENKPVFLSIGYSTCHWCHVMAHESFEDAEVAEILNRDFISIKVDREERPDVDAVYMSVCQALNGSGGWPLTILMTPEQKPFFAVTYLPKHGNFRQFGLIDLLEKTVFLWKENRDTLLHTGDAIAKELNRKESGKKRVPTRNLLHQTYLLFNGRFDRRWGGFGIAPKFPTPHNMLFLMRYGQLEQKPTAMEMAEVTLDAMARGGIHDQIGGGFSRYSTDEMWLVPHFEKMLYDNALLILAYLKAYQITGKAEYADVVHRTTDYVLRELTSPEGGFFCGQDADSDGVEGKYYIFTPDEIKSVLGEQNGSEFCRLYGITENGNFEGKSIPNRIDQAELYWDRGDARLQKLYEYRLTRTKLHKDDKILLSWNAWMIMALARAGQVLGEAPYLDAAVRAYRFIRDNMTDEHGNLYLRYRDGEAAHNGQLDDYATFALAALKLYSVTFDPEYLQEAIQRAKQMTELFEDREEGGYFMTAANAELLITRPKETYDGAIPSGNSVAAMVMQRLAALTGEPMWQETANRQFEFLAAEFEQYPLGCSFGGLAMMDVLYPQKELVCTSKDGLPAELADYLRRSADVHVLFKTEENADALAQCAPFTKDYPVPEQGTMYYLCENGSCKRPVQSFAELNL